MKKILISSISLAVVACSSLFPYKDQSLEYLQGIEQDPSAYVDRVVSFSGEVKGITEDARRLRLVLKIAVPLYEQTTGKNPLSYDLLLVSFDKNTPQMTGIKKGNTLKILARVASCETRKNLIGAEVRVLHVRAFALADRTTRQDFFHPQTPSYQLYESWKAGKLFFKEQPADIEKRYVPPASVTPSVSVPPKPSSSQPTQPRGIVYDEEEPPFDVNTCSQK